MVALMAVTLFTAAVPAFAMEHGASHEKSDADCTKECDLLLKNCAREADTIQQKIKKLRAAIKKDGANAQKRDEIKKLQQKLDETKEQLQVITGP